MRLILLSFFLFVHSLAHSQFGLGDLKDNLNKLPVSKSDVANLLIDRLLKTHKDYNEATFNYAISFSDNAGLFEINERFEKQKVLLNQVRASRMDNDDIEPETRADDLNKTGEIFYANNKFSAAELCFLRAMMLYHQEELGEGEKYAGTLSNLALLYHTSGRYHQAEERIEELMELRSKLGKDALGYGVALNNKAVLYKDLGRYHEAEELLNEGEAIVLDYQGEESLDYAIIINNRAMLYQTLGRYDEALELMNKSLEVAVLSVKEKSPEYIKLQTNLALLYRDKGELEQAGEVYLEAMDNKRSRLGKNHPDYAQLSTGLAALYMEMGKTDEVEELLTDAIDIYEKKLGRDHPAHARAESDLGNFYRVQKNYDKAEPLLTHALNVRSKQLGDRHPDYVKSLEDMALLRWGQQKIEPAKRYFSEVIDRSLGFVDDFFGPMSEHEKTRFWDKFQPRIHRYYAFVGQHYQEHPDLLDEFFNVRLKTKALILVSYNQVRKAIFASGDSVLIDQYNDWIDTKEKLANLYTYSKEELREQEIDIDEIELKANDLESELSKRSNAFDEGFLSQQHYKPAEFQEKLATNEALVEIVEYRQFDGSFIDQMTYGYYIIKGDQQEPVFLLSENGNDLDGKYLNYYRNVIRSRKEDKYSYDQYWKSVEEQLKGNSRVYVALDGVYSQINLNTLSDGNDYLIGAHEFVFLNHSKDFLALKNNVNRFEDALLVGNPTFGGSALSPLPGTAKEVTALNAIIKANKRTVHELTGDKATEAAVKEHHFDLLHVATHGFFLEDISTATKERIFGVETSKAQENPLHRSGLLLAGAGNHMDENYVNHSAENNGVLTAYEIKNLNLSDVNLVVLSACETGRGDVKVGEGVYGMQRAFQEAGAGQLVMSLWKVDDKATADLMIKFYNNMMTGRYTVSQAFRQAVLAIRKTHADPYYWGAFVLIN